MPGTHIAPVLQIKNREVLFMAMVEKIYEKFDISRCSAPIDGDRNIYRAISKEHLDEVFATGLDYYLQRCKRSNDGRIALKFLPNGGSPIWMTLTENEEGVSFEMEDTVYSGDEEDLRDFETVLDGMIPLEEPTYEIGIKLKMTEIQSNQTFCVAEGYSVNKWRLLDETNEIIAQVKGRYDWFKTPDETNTVYYFEGDGLILVQHNGSTKCSVLFYVRELDYNRGKHRLRIKG